MFNGQISLGSAVLNNKIGIFTRGLLRAFNVIRTVNFQRDREILQHLVFLKLSDDHGNLFSPQST